MKRSNVVLSVAPVFLVGALLVSGCPPPSPPSPPPPPPTTAAPHGGGPYVDISKIPAARSGFNGPAIVAATSTPIAYPDGVGAFRTDCRLSHMNFDDPIVYPGRKGASHLHAFYGNVGMNFQTTSAQNGANTTCSGGTANRSGYWVPAMIDVRNGAPVVSDYFQIYYKTGYQGVRAQDVQAPPAELRMVAGSAMRSTPDRTGHTYYFCSTSSARSASIPACPPGSAMAMAVVFPQCWNGRDLDSPDHISHMAYPTGSGCPPSHPVPLPEITEHVWYNVPAAGTASWRLATDRYDGPGGYSAHADWWNGWDRTVMQTLLRNCLNAGKDCRTNLLGDGTMLRAP